MKQINDDCSPIDNWVETYEGPKKIKDLIGNQFKAIINDTIYDSSIIGFYKTTKTNLIEIVCEEGYEIKCSENHSFLLSNNSTKLTKHLKIDDELILNENNVENWYNPDLELPDAYYIGILVFDNIILLDNIPQYCVNNKIIDMYRKSNALDILDIILKLNPDNIVSDTIEYSNKTCYIHFIQGIYDNNIILNYSSIGLKSPNIILLKLIQRMFLRLGIFCVIEDIYLFIRGYNILKFQKIIGVLYENLNHKLNRICDVLQETKKQKFITKIKNITKTNTIVSVYNCQIKKYSINGFICGLNDIIDYNCISEGTMIKTIEGDKLIENLTTSDSILYFDIIKNKFKYSNILYTGLTRARAEVYKIIFENNKELIATFDHELLIYNNKKRKLEYVRINELTTDLMGVYYNPQKYLKLEYVLPIRINFKISNNFNSMTLIKKIEFRLNNLSIIIDKQKEPQMSCKISNNLIKIKKIIKLIETSNCYDIRISSDYYINHNFIANGFVVHNSTQI